MPFIESFEPVIGENPKVLILGSIPGIASLQAQQYYAHPRNAFWPIMAKLFDVDWSDDYQSRIEQVKCLPVVLWDTLKACHREGSLDSAITKDRLEANDIVGLLKQVSSIRLIAFNGAASEKYFKQTVAKLLTKHELLNQIRLPSTSPAHASKNFQQKLEDWKVITEYLP
ncbi:MAG: DNA-deoxyinosine glycosylase [Gammaproteobacteria bacterium]|nr:DNA-deoxyinosine glycosylase [Gammaproteobacteria bacterium]